MKQSRKISLKVTKYKFTKKTVENYLENRPINEVIQSIASEINKSEQNLSREVRRTLSQLRIYISPLYYFLTCIKLTLQISPVHHVHYVIRVLNMTHIIYFIVKWLPVVNH